MSTRDGDALSSSAMTHPSGHPRLFSVGQVVLAPIIPKVGFRKALSGSKKRHHHRQRDAAATSAGPMFVSLPLPVDRAARAITEPNGKRAEVRQHTIAGSLANRVAYLEGDIQFGRATVSGLACYGNMVVRFDDTDVDVQVPCGMVHPWTAEFSDPLQLTLQYRDAHRRGEVVKREPDAEPSDERWSSARLNSNVGGGARDSPLPQRRRLESLGLSRDKPTVSSRPQGPATAQPPIHIAAAALVARLAETLSVNRSASNYDNSSKTSSAAAFTSTLCLFTNPRLLSLCSAAWQHLPGFRSGSLRLFRLVDDNCIATAQSSDENSQLSDIATATPSCSPTFFALQGDFEDALLECQVLTTGGGNSDRGAPPLLPTFAEIPCTEFLAAGAASASTCRLHSISRVVVVHDGQPSTGAPSSSNNSTGEKLSATAVEGLLATLNRLLCRVCPLPVEHIVVLGQSSKTLVLPIITPDTNERKQKLQRDEKPSALNPKAEARGEEEEELRLLLPSRLSSLRSLYGWLSSLEGDVSLAPEPLDSDAFEREWQKRSWCDLLGISTPSRQLRRTLSQATPFDLFTEEEESTCGRSPLYEYLRAVTADAWTSLSSTLCKFPRTLILASLPGCDEASLPRPWHQVVELVACGSHCRVATPLSNLRFTKETHEFTWDEAVLARWRHHGGFLIMPVPAFQRKETTMNRDSRGHTHSSWSDAIVDDDDGCGGGRTRGSVNTSLLVQIFRCCYSADSVVVLGGEAARWYRSSVPAFLWGEGCPGSILVANEMEMALRAAVGLGLPRCLASVKHLSWMLWDEPPSGNSLSSPAALPRADKEETATALLKRKVRQLYLSRYPAEEILSTPAL